MYRRSRSHSLFFLLGTVFQLHAFIGGGVAYGGRVAVASGEVTEDHTLILLRVGVVASRFQRRMVASDCV